MSIAIITIRDDGDDKLGLNVEFEPPLPSQDEVKAGAKVPATHATALRMLDAVATPDAQGARNSRT